MQCVRNENNGEWLPAPIAVELPGRLLVEEGLHELRNPNGTRQCASGRTLHERATDIKNMFPVGGCCISIDAASFDGSLGHLARIEREEFLVYAKRKRFYRRHLQQVIEQQNSLKLHNRDGYRGVLKLNRASGTAGTSAGNKCVMLAALIAACGPAYTMGLVWFYCDGDDTLIFLSPELTEKFDRADDDTQGPSPEFRSWMRRCGQLGLSITLENTARSFSEVLFCRSKPALSRTGWMMCKIPSSAFQNMTCIVRHFRSPQLPTYLSTLRQGFCKMWDGVPVLGSMGRIYPDNGKVNLSLLSTNGAERWIAKDPPRSGATAPTTPKSLPPPPTDEARAAFTDAFGIGVDEQVLLEGLFEKIGEDMKAAVRDYAPVAVGDLRITVS